MDYTAIIEALDARTLEAFKVWGETFAAGMKAALDERDATIAAQGEQIAAMQKLLGEQGDRLTLALGEILREGIDTAQKQVREALESLAVPTYKGVFERGATYQAGDMVTYKGSIWHCNTSLSEFSNNLEVPGNGDAWTLAVKCGRDGKDLTREAAE